MMHTQMRRLTFICAVLAACAPSGAVAATMRGRSFSHTSMQASDAAGELLNGTRPDDIPDPQCTRGVISPDYKACCAKGCGSCGSHKLCGDVGKYHEVTGKLANECCYERVLKLAPSCTKDHPPCVLPDSYKKQLNTWEEDRPKRHAMQDCNKAIPKTRDSHSDATDKGEFLARLYLEGRTKYLDAKRIAEDVQSKCAGKIEEAEETLAKLKSSIKEAKGADAKAEYASTLKAEEAAAISEKKFYEMIKNNAGEVIDRAVKGLDDVRALEAKAKKLKDVSPLQLELNALVGDAEVVYKEALALWKQWQDSSKDYDCGHPPPTKNAKSVCTKGNTKYQPTCSVTCAEGFDGAGTSNTLRCSKVGKYGKELSGEWTGMAVCAGRVCGFPPEKKNANFVKSSIRYPEVAHYTCHEGFFTSDGHHQYDVPCAITGKFSEQVPHQCKGVTCGAAPEFENTILETTVASGEFHYTDEASFQCLEGHTLTGAAGGTTKFTIVCQGTGKFDQGRPCQPVRCGPPPILENSKITHTSNGHKSHQHVGDEASYACDPGYSMTATVSGQTKFTFVCMADGEFALKGHKGNRPHASCLPVSGGIPDLIPHGIFARREMFFGEVVVVTAEYGYSTTGKYGKGVEFNLAVSTDGRIIGAKTLLPVECGEPPIAGKAEIDFHSKVAVYQDVVTYKCADGYSIDRSKATSSKHFTIECQANAHFSPMPEHGECLNIDDCSGHSCGHGTCVDGHMDYSCKCDPGFKEEIFPSTGHKHCGNIDDCGAQACGVGKCIDLIKDYKCECPAGYEQVVELNGKRKDKTCRPVLCGFPESAPKAHIVPAEAAKEKAYFGSTTVYQCENGYTLDGKVHGKNNFYVDCEADKQFSKMETCSAITCDSVPAVEHGKWTATAVQFDKSISFECDKGYSVDGSATGDKSFAVTCQDSGAFTHPEGCQPISCGEPPDVAHAHHVFVKKVYGDKVEYKCFPGFSLDGSNKGKTSFTVECQADGKFTEHEECLPKVCGVVSEEHTLYAYPEKDGPIHFPLSTSIICLDGFTVDGKADGNKSFSVFCLETGEFSRVNKENMCEHVECGLPQKMDNAKLITESKPKFFGDHVEYECLEGYTTGGEHDAPTKYEVACLGTGHFGSPTDDMLCRNVNDCEGHTCGARGRCKDLIGPSPSYTCECEEGYEVQTADNGEKVCGNVDDCKGTDCGVGVCKDLVGGYTCSCPQGYFVGIKENGDKSCLPVMCVDHTPEVDEAKLVSKHTGPVVFPQTLIYKCMKGYTVDGTSMKARSSFQTQCKADGQLHGLAECQKISCGAPHVLPHTSVLEPHEGSTSIVYKDKAKYKCDDGFTILGKKGGEKRFSVQCEADGHLTVPEVCKRVICGEPPDVANAKVGLATEGEHSGLKFEETVKYECDIGHTLNGKPDGKNEFTVRCLKNGDFSKIGGPCKPVTIKTPTVKNADIKDIDGKAPTDAPTISFPTSLTYECIEGHTFDGLVSGATTFTTRVNRHGELTPKLPVDGCKKIAVYIHGQVKDARNGEPLVGVKVSVEGTDISDIAHSGYFALDNVQPGEVRVVFEMEGYIRVVKTIHVTASIETGGAADTSMSPKLKSDQYRVVLKWGEEPEDLDSHAYFGPENVCFWDKKAETDFIKGRLEHDDVDSFGPETVHLSGVGKCTSNAYDCDIRYSVHDWLETGKLMDNAALTEVTLYTGDRVAGSWKLHDCLESVSEDGYWWRVFDLDAKTNKLKWSCGDGMPPDPPTHPAALLLQNKTKTVAGFMTPKASAIKK